MKKILIIIITVFCLFLGGCESARINNDIDQGTGNSITENTEPTTTVVYSLKKAYDMNILSIEDIRAIHDIHCESNDFCGEINKEVETRIKNDILNSYLTDSTNITIDDVSIVKFYGCYNHAYVIGINRVDKIIIEPSRYLIIGGESHLYVFNFKNDYTIIVWKEDYK